MFQLIVDNDIILKELNPANAGLIFNVINSNREFLRKWLSWVDTTNAVEDTIFYVQSVANPDIYKSRIVFEIWYKEIFTGLIDFHGSDQINKKVEIGYWLAENFQGKGIVTKACKACIDYAFNNFDIEKINIKCAIGNIKSQKIPQRLKFKLEQYEKNFQDSTGEELVIVVFSMLKEEWLNLYCR